MDDEAKKFFEELTHMDDNKVSVEPQIEFAKATSLAMSPKKTAKKSWEQTPLT